ncbi:uncharacterized protein K452DRAFT_51003 [Aplosporella prunicola CBS 121167]|uniref:C2H2-type domain-containing protein n=1 Tax=Aplosporella prunicola CBS 121167 TaxID=1176127 RepID=A0A6A6BB02_9PEZI|nr:uncharacterized protein K452DRAFT_51003 [Aplosporella prunicola CBS 121167]KAF2140768.1 hypothetical protein K452DRAFT_51003 [Aplosporella prunicola CBS 121167]
MDSCSIPGFAEEKITWHDWGNGTLSFSPIPDNQLPGSTGHEMLDDSNGSQIEENDLPFRIGSEPMNQGNDEPTGNTPENMPSGESSRQLVRPDDAHATGRYQCVTCGVCRSNSSDLQWHGNDEQHDAFACSVHGCSLTFTVGSGVSRHVRRDHPEMKSCRQCGQGFPFITSLSEHAASTGHAAFACTVEGCESAFSRFDVLRRHQESHQSVTARFPCKYCKRHRGADSLKRRDHLTQHLRNYHHMGVDEVSSNQRSCPHDGCPESRPDIYDMPYWKRDHAFKKSAEYIAHMRKVHKESDFPCTEPGCNRGGPKGYFRERDLLKHKAKEHGIPIE